MVSILPNSMDPSIYDDLSICIPALLKRGGEGWGFFFCMTDFLLALEITGTDPDFLEGVCHNF